MNSPAGLSLASDLPPQGVFISFKLKETHLCLQISGSSQSAISAKMANHNGMGSGWRSGEHGSHTQRKGLSVLVRSTSNLWPKKQSRLFKCTGSTRSRLFTPAQDLAWGSLICQLFARK